MVVRAPQHSIQPSCSSSCDSMFQENQKRPKIYSRIISKIPAEIWIEALPSVAGTGAKNKIKLQINTQPVSWKNQSEWETI